MGPAAKPSALVYTQALRSSIGGLAVAEAAALRKSQGQLPGLTGLSPSPSPLSASSTTQSGGAWRAAAASGVANPDVLRRLFRTSSSGISLLSIPSHKSYCMSGEFNAEAVDEETAGTAAPAISAADHNNARQILHSSDAAAAAVSQLGTVPEGDGELCSNNGSVADTAAAAGGGGAAGGGQAEGSSNGMMRERLVCRMAKAPPMMSRSAYLQVCARGDVPKCLGNSHTKVRAHITTNKRGHGASAMIDAVNADPLIACCSEILRMQ